MVDRHMIEVATNLTTVSYDTGIEIRILPNGFYGGDRFTLTSFTTIGKILDSKAAVSIDNLLFCFLYTSSYIGHRPRDANGNEILSNPSEYPEAFFQNIHTMAKETGLCRDSINNCLKVLVDLGILIKYKIPQDDTLPLNMPNIYVLKDENYKQEITWAIEKMSGIYQKDKTKD